MLMLYFGTRMILFCERASGAGRRRSHNNNRYLRYPTMTPSSSLVAAVGVPCPKPTRARYRRDTSLKEKSTRCQVAHVSSLKSRRLSPRASASAFASEASPGAHIVWLRAGDLRTHDHPALTAAAAMAETQRKVLPVFIFDPNESALCTPATLRTLHESVCELRTTLRSLGSDLAIRVGDPSVELPTLASAIKASSAAVHEELEWARRGSYRKTLDALQAANVSYSEWSAGLRIPTSEGLETAASTAEAARSTKGAPLFAHKTDAAFIAACGAVATPLPAPESLPGIPPHADENEKAAAAEGGGEASSAPEGGVVDGLLSEIPSLVGLGCVSDTCHPPLLQVCCKVARDTQAVVSFDTLFITVFR